MKSIAASNPHLRTASARKEGVERNVRSSCAIEGVSSKVFRSAITGQHMAASKDRPTPAIKKRPQK